MLAASLSLLSPLLLLLLLPPPLPLLLLLASPSDSLPLPSLSESLLLSSLLRVPARSKAAYPAAAL
jgi:hypothetical protein